MGQFGGAVHRAAVGNGHQQLARLAARAQALHGPGQGLTVHAFAEQVGPQQRSDVAPRVAPAGGGVLEHQVRSFVQPAGVARAAGTLPVARRAAEIGRAHV